MDGLIHLFVFVLTWVLETQNKKEAFYSFILKELE